MSKLVSGEEVVRQVRAEIGARSILSFSTGKDRIAAHLAVRDSFDEVIPYFLYLVPGLEFVAQLVAPGASPEPNEEMRGGERFPPFCLMQAPYRAVVF